VIYQTSPDDATLHASGWIPFGDLEITAAPLIVAGGDPPFARLTYRDALAVAARFGARLLTLAEHDELWRIGRKLRPVLKTPGPDMASLEYARQHDAELIDQLVSWDGTTPLANAGKQWVAGAAPGRALNYGWWSTMAPKGRMWQTLGTRHDDRHTDYSQLTMLVRGGPQMLTRSTIKIGSSGRDVEAWQKKFGIRADGHFGPVTEAATKAWQDASGLVADGIVGAKSWAMAGETPATVKDSRAPACRAALRDANAMWPTRNRASDGIMGDTAHQARPSDHNQGNAVDITHDRVSGADGDTIADYAIEDARTTYVIWNAQIYSRARAAEGWRPYAGANPHRHHVHISVRVDSRNDDSPWPWAPR